MPRPVQRKARKAYPKNGIEKGDLYWFVSIKQQRGGIILRQKQPFKASQLTTSPFRSGWLAAAEEFEAGDKDADALRVAAEAIREVGREAQESFDNMPEGLQQGETGQMLESRADMAESVADDLETLADDLEDLEEPEAMEEPEGDEESNPEGWEAWEQWTDEQDHYATEIARIPEEAENLLGDMPE